MHDRQGAMSNEGEIGCTTGVSGAPIAHLLATGEAKKQDKLGNDDNVEAIAPQLSERAKQTITAMEQAKARDYNKVKATTFW